MIDLSLLLHWCIKSVLMFVCMCVCVSVTPTETGNAAATSASQLLMLSDAAARARLVDGWKDTLLDFLLQFIPTLSIPDIDGMMTTADLPVYLPDAYILGVREDVRFSVSGLDLAGIKLKKEGEFPV